MTCDVYVVRDCFKDSIIETDDIDSAKRICMFLNREMYYGFLWNDFVPFSIEEPGGTLYHFSQWGAWPKFTGKRSKKKKEK